MSAHDYPRLQLGWHLGSAGDPVEIELLTPQIANHTAILAQSGSGKSFLVGRLVEEILLKTRCRVLILDANGGFRNVGEVADRPWQEEHRSRWPRLAGGEAATREEFEQRWKALVPVARLREDGDYRIPFGLLLCENQAALLGIDPAREPSAYAMLANTDRELFDETGGGYAPAELLAAVESREGSGGAAGQGTWAARAAADRVTTALQRVQTWAHIWAPPDGVCDLEQQVAAGDWRLAVLDLPSLWADLPSAQGEWARMVVTLYTLEAVLSQANEGWRTAMGYGRAERRPLFVVIDEAHNFAPAEPRDALTGLVSERIRRCAAEGRKYGLFLVLITQRPAKMAPGLLAECENVCLLRL